MAALNLAAVAAAAVLWRRTAAFYAQEYLVVRPLGLRVWGACPRAADLRRPSSLAATARSQLGLKVAEFWAFRDPQGLGGPRVMPCDALGLRARKPCIL